MIQELEGIINDVENKNKELVDKLNMTIYNRAEQYKEKVISKLQERSGTPNRYSSNASNKRAATEGAEVNRFY